MKNLVKESLYTHTSEIFNQQEVANSIHIVAQALSSGDDVDFEETLTKEDLKDIEFEIGHSLDNLSHIDYVLELKPFELKRIYKLFKRYRYIN